MVFYTRLGRLVPLYIFNVLAGDTVAFNVKALAYDMRGSLLYIGMVPAGGGSAAINMQPWPAGVYMVSLSVGL